MNQREALHEAKLRLLLQMNRTINDYIDGDLEKAQTLIFVDSLYNQLKTLLESDDYTPCEGL